MVVKTKVKAAWRRNFLRQLRQRTPFESARLLGIGRERINQERRRDPEFAEEMDRVQKERQDRRS